MGDRAARRGEIETRLAALSNRELCALVLELADLSEANRIFLAARLLSPSERTQRLAELRRELETLVHKRTRAPELRRLVRAYVRASDDDDGAARLLVRHLRTMVRAMRDSGAHRPPAGFTALVGELSRLKNAATAGTTGEVEQELRALADEARRVNDDLAEWITSRIARSCS